MAKSKSKTPKKYPNNLQHLRNGAGWKQEELAELLGVKRLSVLRWETGKQPIPNKRIAQLTELFGVSEIELRFPQIEHPPKLIKLTGVIDENGDLLFRRGIGTIPCPPGMDSSIVTRAALVEGDINLPLMNLKGWVLLFFADPEQDLPLVSGATQPVYPKPQSGEHRFNRFIGTPCIVERDDGRLQLRKVMRGSNPGLFSLWSHNLKIEENVLIRECYPIMAMLSPADTQKLQAAEAAQQNKLAKART